MAAKYPGEIRVLSGTTRAALANYTVAVSKVVARHNVIINILLPGMHHSAFVDKQFNERAAAKGITYDTGFIRGGRSREHVDPAVVERELRIIRDDLHCTVELPMTAAALGMLDGYLRRYEAIAA